MSDLNDFLKVLAQGKKQTIEASPGKKALKQLSESLHKDNPFLKETPVKAKPAKPVKPEGPEVVGEFVLEEGKFTHASELNEVVVPEVKPAAEQVPMSVINKYLKRDASFQQPDPDKADPTIRALQDKLKFLEQAIGRIAATGPGSGEVNFRYLDDVDRASISAGRFLTYNPATKLFTFDEINTDEVVYNTTTVTTATYTVQNGDYYIGVDYAGPCTITLPATATSGRTIIIKDEDGDAERNPITVIGTVDNDPAGFILKINNGAIQMIYRNGWRII